jgi:hypothetical protein
VALRQARLCLGSVSDDDSRADWQNSRAIAAVSGNEAMRQSYMASSRGSDAIISLLAIGIAFDLVRPPTGIDRDHRELGGRGTSAATA